LRLEEKCGVRCLVLPHPHASGLKHHAYSNDPCGSRTRLGGLKGRCPTDKRTGRRPFAALSPKLTADKIHSMKSDGVVRQYLWFAFGLWAACTYPVVVDAAFFHPLVRSAHVPPIEWFVIGFIPLSLVLSVVFLLWIGVRVERRKTRIELRWAVPLLFGVLYLPVCYLLLLLLMRFVVAESWENVVIVSLLFGLPAVFGEIAFQMSQRRIAASASGRS
jgi:hypothetical protein